MPGTLVGPAGGWAQPELSPAVPAWGLSNLARLPTWPLRVPGACVARGGSWKLLVPLRPGPQCPFPTLWLFSLW